MSSRAVPPGDCDRDTMLAEHDALDRMLAAARPVAGSERVALGDALGRVLAEDLVSPFDVPGHRNSAVDGFALDGADLDDGRTVELRVIGESFAGRPFTGRLARGEAVRVMTGAVMPDGADTVVMQEDVEYDGATVRFGPGHERGRHVREAGEDIRRGATVLEAGRRLMPAEVGLAASLGLADVEVRRRVRVAVLSTGDELRVPGQALGHGDIYDSNRYTLQAMLARLGCEVVDLGIVADDRERFRAAFSEAATRADAIVSSAGASGGEADYVAETLAELGAVDFWRIAIRPGRPVAFGTIGDALLFGLPGNPVAVMVTFYRFCDPVLRRLQGEHDPRPMPTVDAVCTVALRKRIGRAEVYRAVLDRDRDGRLSVRSTGAPGSALLHTMSDANCFILLPAERGPVAAGDIVAVQPFFGLV